LGDCLEALANQAFLRSGSQDPVEPEAAYLRDAVTYTRGREPKEDFPKLADVLEHWLEDHEGLLYLSATHRLDLNDYERALACIDGALRLKPNDPRAWLNKGLVVGKLGYSREELEACFDQALRLKPDYHEALLNKGLALLALGYVREAVEACHEALRLNPNYPDVWNEIGAILADLGYLPEALEHYEVALGLTPDYAIAWNNKGVALAKLGYLPEALEAYEKALRFNPNYPDAWNNKGMTLAKLGRHNEAVKWLCKAWYAWKKNPNRRVLAAENLLALGHDPETCTE